MDSTLRDVIGSTRIALTFSLKVYARAQRSGLAQVSMFERCKYRGIAQPHVTLYPLTAQLKGFGHFAIAVYRAPQTLYNIKLCNLLPFALRGCFGTRIFIGKYPPACR